jgi:hypothetical protein
MTRGQRYKYKEYHKIIDNIEYKKCSICEEWFLCNEDYFYKNKGNKSDGLNPECKECTKKQSSNWIKNNPKQFYSNYYKY